MSAGGGDGVTDGKAAKPVTAAQDCISTIVNVKPLDIFKEASGEFQAVFVVTKTYIFKESLDITSCIVATLLGVFF